MSPNKVSFQTQEGQTFEADDTAANRKLAADKGYQVNESLPRSVGEFARGVDETIASHDITNYNPLLWIPQYLMKGVASVTGAKPSSEIKAEQDALPKDNKVSFYTAEGQSFRADNTPENIKLAQERGYHIESVDEAHSREFKAAPENQGLRGSAKAYLENVGNDVAFGIPNLARDKQGQKDFADLNAQHPIASTLGSVAGTAANIAMTGGMGGTVAAAEKVGAAGAARAAGAVGITEGSLLGRMAESAGKHAAAGAVYSAPHATAEAIFGDPAKAGESMAIGIGLGAVLGSASPLLGSLPNVIRKGAQESGMNAEDRYMKMIGMQKGTMKKIGDEESRDIAQVLIDAGANEGVIKGGKEQIVKNIAAIKDNAGKQIGNAGKIMDDLIARDPEKLALHGFNLSAATDAIETKYGEQLGQQLKTNRSRDNFIKTLIDDSMSIGYGKEATKGIETIADAQEALKGLPALPFQKAQEIKKFIGGHAALGKRFDLLTDNEMVARDIYRSVSGELENGIERTADAIGDPTLSDAYKLAKRQYAAVSTIEDKDLLENMMATAKGNRMIGLTDFIHGSNAGTTGAIIGGIVGGGLGAAVGSTVAKVGSVILKKTLESTPAQSFAVKVLDGMNMNFRALSAEAMNSRFSALTDMLAGEGTSIGSRLAASNAINPMAEAVGSKETDPKAAYEAFKSTVEPLVNDPEKLQKKIEPMMSAIANSGDSDAAYHYMQHQVQVVNYLYSKMPKQEMNPSLFLNREYVPSKAELTRFSEICAAAQDPFYIVRKIEQGQLNKDQIDTVKVLYPQISSLIAERIKSMGYKQQLESGQPNLPYNVRLRMQQLTGALGDPSMSPQKAMSLQANFKKKTADGIEANNKASSGKSFDKANLSNATTNQRMGLK